tara:strand:+ start:71 stop:352 length:282 start_codon:yes stop_codon:yes gene_type:complete
MAILWEVRKKSRNVNVRIWCNHRGVTTYEEFESALLKEEMVPPEARDVDVLKYLASLGPKASATKIPTKATIKNKTQTSRKKQSAKPTTKTKK